MDLPVLPPVLPMLAKAVKELPQPSAYPDDDHPGLLYEPKWDGFRCLVFKDGDDVRLDSRNAKPLTRYFPEVVEALRSPLLPARCVLDGELIVAIGPRLDFDRLQERIHPAKSRVTMLSETTPAAFVAFDLLAIDDEDLTRRPLAVRRERLEAALAERPDLVHLTRVTTDPDVALRWFEQFEGAGLDGVVAKPLKGGYQPNVRAMLKVKHQRTADVVVAGYRLHKTSTEQKPLLGSLLLGLYDDEGNLRHVGVSASFAAARRASLLEELQPLVSDGTDHPWGQWAEITASGERIPGGGSRWSAGKDLSFVPLRPERVLEVAYDHMEGERFRHTAQFRRWRTDRDPITCTYEQLEEPVSYDLADVLED
ncbi:ATP-dependent DNA ligase [Nocardioides caldifontis]|uniref:ATP-dependent DNA ligase n=1 Tax=Nocardioides caldifontis TaxID=2588938 RepID=UPI0011DFF1FE|nr:ATP-dependent DNA ligase [Nocardioides caldifontis]